MNGYPYILVCGRLSYVLIAPTKSASDRNDGDADYDKGNIVSAFYFQTTTICV